MFNPMEHKWILGTTLLLTSIVLVFSQDLADETWKQSHIDDGAEIMIPARGIGGVIVLGESMVTYFSGKEAHVTAHVEETTFKVC